VPSELHLLSATVDGSLWHATLVGDPPTWQPFTVIAPGGPAGDLSGFASVSCAEVGGGQHVTVVTQDGALWYSLRESDPPSWQVFSLLAPGGPAWTQGPFKVIAASGNPASASLTPSPNVDDLHVFAVRADGGLSHRVRDMTTGSWLPFEDVKLGSYPPFSPIMVDAASADGASSYTGDPSPRTIHLCVATGDGRILHSQRLSGGVGWRPFSSLNAGGQGTDPRWAGAVHLDRLACAAAGSTLHVLAIDTDGAVWHSIAGSPSNQPFYLLTPGGPGGDQSFAQIACAVAGFDLHVFAAAASGGLWHAVRNDAAGSWQPFEEIQAGAAGTIGVVSGVAAAVHELPDAG
jgi:hypothetical protein